MTDTLERARQLTKDGRFKQAQKELTEVIKFEPRNALAFQKLGQAHLGIGQYAEATIAFQKALELDPGLAFSHAGLGFIHLVHKEYSKSEQEFNQAIQLEPTSAKAKLNLGYLFAVQGRYMEGEALVNQVIQTDPTKSYPYWILSEIYALQKQLADSDKTMWHAFRLKPNLDNGRILVQRLMRHYGALGIIPAIAIVLIASQGTSLVNMLIVVAFTGWGFWKGMYSIRLRDPKRTIFLFLSVLIFDLVYIQQWF